jgi:hypothetical protein
MMIQLERTERPTGEIDGDKALIRQIAILLHTLPQRTHRVLLGQLDGEEKRRIDQELRAIGKVDAMEQYRVLKRMRDQLHAETESVEKVESEIQDEIQIGRARVSKKRASPMYRGGDAVSEGVSESPSENAEHHDTNSRPLATSYAPGNGHVTTIFQTQADVVPGQAAMAPTPEMLQLMFAQFHQTQAAGVLPLAAMERGEQPSEAVTQNVAPNPCESRDGRPCTMPINPAVRMAEAQRATPRDGEMEAAELAARVDEFLNQLPPRDLCRYLGMVTTKQAFLVLCGLPNHTAETVLEMLPRRQSRKVRNDMRRMGQLQLSDIDAAKQVVTEIALRLTTQPTSLVA